MRRCILAFALAFCTASAATAGPIVEQVLGFSPSGARTITFVVDPDDAELQYDTIGLSRTQGFGIFADSQFGGTSFAQVDPMADPMGVNGPEDSAILGITGFSLLPGEDSSTALTGSIASLGNNFVSFGVSEVAQIVFSDNPGRAGTFSFGFFDDGQLLTTVSGTLLPEPTSAAVLLPALLACCGRRRRA